MITPEEFAKEYRAFVLEWVQFRNVKNQTEVDDTDFWEKLLSKVVIDEILDTYDDKHYSKASPKM